tara:strand:- start:210 stop:629 length:420 start_codon:yes stop_codon:yes gene_type:complete
MSLNSASKAGDQLGPVKLEPITRTTLALFAGGSNDHYGIHIDTDYAKNVGLDDVIGHGMLSMALIGRVLNDWAGQANLRGFKCRFVGSTSPGDTPTITAQVVEQLEVDGESRARLELVLTNQIDDVKVTAQAEVALANS